MLLAYLDKQNLITIELSIEHYQGESRFFYSRDKNGKKKLLKIIDKINLDKHIEYKLETSDLKIGQMYEIVEEHGLSTVLCFRYVVHQKFFDDEFYYDGNLGINYSHEKTSFKLWAPTATEVILKLIKDDKVNIYIMEKGDFGVYFIEVEGDLENFEYIYLVGVNGVYNSTIDPYAIASTPNNQRSVVVDINKISNKKYFLPKLDLVDSIIYEISVKDISSLESSNIMNKGKFLGLTEKGTKSNRGYPTGIDYIKSLGITHVQIMPFFDFGSIDELNFSQAYNWGYDPVAYNLPEGSYATGVTNAYTRLIECKRMIDSFHQEGIGVIMDVVYNHVYDRISSSFEKCVPYYYFRYDDKKNISNGSYCHNDLETTRLMVRKYIIDSLIFWTKNYQVDGFRFDLMGIIDIETMNLIKTKLLQINPNLIFYGEGWNMPTALIEESKSTISNSHLLPGIGFFNDRFREFIKGSTWSYSITEKGYIGGNTLNLHIIKNILSGSCTQIGCEPLFISPDQAINYIESHDNRTVYDKLSISNFGQTKKEIYRRIKISFLILMISQGVPFVHSGQEFARTKKGIENSYNYLDDINGIDYNLRDDNYELVNYFKDCIALRKSEPLFRIKTSQEIAQKLYFHTPEFKFLLYGIKDEKKEYLILINVLEEDYEYLLDDNYHLIFDENGFQDRLINNKINLNAVSIKVLVKTL